MRFFPLSLIAAAILTLSSCAAVEKITGFVLGPAVTTGDVGGDGDSVALWIAIAGLTSIALVAYPAQRAARLAWNSWQGKTRSRSGKGSDLCIKHSEWDS
jgi:hypothetical protein